MACSRFRRFMTWIDDYIIFYNLDHYFPFYSLRRNICCIMCFWVLYTIGYMYLLQEELVGLVYRPAFLPTVRHSDAACTVPELKLTSLQEWLLFNPPRSLECHETMPDLFYLSKNGYLNLTENHIKRIQFGGVHTHFSCEVEDKLSGLHRNKDGKGILHKSTTFPFKIQGDYAKVSCLTRKGDVIFKKYYLNPLPNRPKRFTKESADRYSVLFFVVDSVSVAAFKRYMPKTQNVLNSMGFTSFESFNKIGINTFPNVIAMLTGILAQHNEGSNDRSTVANDLPLILKNFSKQGYVTSFIEDDPIIGLFHYFAKIRASPTDYYYWSFFDEILQYTDLFKDGQRCIGGRLAIEFLLDAISTTYVKYPDTLKFTFAFVIAPHNDDANAAVIDRPIAHFFNKSYQMDTFNNTIIFFLSDHGTRITRRRRNSKFYSYEKHLPFLSVYLPPNFRQRHPNVTANLEYNSAKRRLLTPFDIHETLLDIAQANFNGSGPGPAGTKRKMLPTEHPNAVSIFERMPANRTCKSAGIPVQFCSCIELNWTPADVNSQTVKNTANKIIEKINAVLTQKLAGMCHKLTFSKILEAHMLEVEGSSYSKIKFQAVEQSAIFETTVTVESEDTVAFSIDNIERIDKYGKQGHCVMKFNKMDVILMERFCICK